MRSLKHSLEKLLEVILVEKPNESFELSIQTTCGNERTFKFIYQFWKKMESMVKKLKQKLRFGSSRKKKEERWFWENGSKFLKELIADCNGKSIPLRTFSSSQILKATKNFDFSCLTTEERDHKWYKGVIDDKSYLIKSFAEYRAIERRDAEAYNDIVLSARMSYHNNFLKLFGCCFEFSFPVFVFEYAEYGILNWQGDIMVDGEDILPWNVRLKIGKEIANAVTYLHTAFPKIIIHRHLKVTNIFLDKNLTAKLSDFSLAVTLPEGESRVKVEGAQGTYGYSDPLYVSTSFVTEYTDVYSFGICLLVLLTGRPVVFTGSDGYDQAILCYVRGLCGNGKLDEVIDPMMVKDITSGQRLQVEACVVLALRCCEEIDEDRPKMIQVAKELKRIETSLRDSS